MDPYSQVDTAWAAVWSQRRVEQVAKSKQSKWQKIVDHVAMQIMRDAQVPPARVAATDAAKDKLDDIKKQAADAQLANIKMQQDAMTAALKAKDDLLKKLTQTYPQPGYNSYHGGGGGGGAYGPSFGFNSGVVSGGNGSAGGSSGSSPAGTSGGGGGGLWGPPPSGSSAPTYTQAAIPPPPPASPVKKPIVSNGMNGFSEKGEPDEWDMAVGEVFGYRWWKLQVPKCAVGYIDAADVPITSTGLLGQNGYLWMPGKQEAKCTRSAYGSLSWDELIDQNAPAKHEPPEARVSCGCGFWAYFDKMLDVSQHFSNLNKEVPFDSAGFIELPVFGVVKGSGRVIIGEKGFRSQYAEVVGLALPDIVTKQLGWFLSSSSPSNFGRDQRGNMYHANWTAAPASFGRQPVAIQPCSSTETKARLATIEALLTDGYQCARVFSDTGALTKYFPPDKNYA